MSFLTLSLLFLQFSSSNAFSKRPVPVKDNSKILNDITRTRMRFDILFKEVEERMDLIRPYLEK